MMGPMAAFLPHRGPALLVDQVEELAPLGGRVRLRPQQGLDCLQLIEAGAQAIGALAGARRQVTGGPPRGGVLGALRDCRLLRSARPGATVLADTVEEQRLGDLSQHRVRLLEDGLPLLEGTITVAEVDQHLHSVPELQGDPGVLPRQEVRDWFPPTGDGLITLPEPPVCRGHFPGHPLLPGVYLLAALARLAELQLGRPLQVRGVAKARFSAPLHPGDRVRCDPVSGRISLADGTPAVACRLHLEPDPAG